MDLPAYEAESGGRETSFVEEPSVSAAEPSTGFRVSFTDGDDHPSAPAAASSPSLGDHSDGNTETPVAEKYPGPLHRFRYSENSEGTPNKRRSSMWSDLSLSQSVLIPSNKLSNLALTCILINYISAGYILLPAGKLGTPMA